MGKGTDGIEPPVTGNSITEMTLHREIVDLATTVFATPKEAIGWLHTPHPMLAGSTPVDICNTAVGLDKVRATLMAIKFGGVV